MSKNTSPNLHSKNSKPTKEQDRNYLCPIQLMEYLHQQIQEHQETIYFLESHFGKVRAISLCQNPIRHITMWNAIIGSLKIQERKERQSEDGTTNASRFCNIRILRSQKSSSKTKEPSQ